VAARPFGADAQRGLRVTPIFAAISNFWTIFADNIRTVLHSIPTMLYFRDSFEKGLKRKKNLEKDGGGGNKTVCHTPTI
jgi:hypothetical protein